MYDHQGWLCKKLGDSVELGLSLEADVPSFLELKNI
jgi:hypothetical protein